MYTGIDNRLATDPDIVLNSDRCREFPAQVSGFKMDRMTSGKQTDIRSKEYIVPNGHCSAVQYGTIVVAVEVLPDGDVIAIITMKRGLNEKARAQIGRA